MSRRLENKRILIAEDLPVVALELQLAFEDEGATVVGPFRMVGDIHEEILSGVDVAAINVHLADGDAYPIAERLMQRGIPFFFLTGHLVSPLPQCFATARRVAKPYIVHELIELTAHLVAESVERASVQVGDISPFRPDLDQGVRHKI